MEHRLDTSTTVILFRAIRARTHTPSHKVVDAAGGRRRVQSRAVLLLQYVYHVSIADYHRDVELAGSDRWTRVPHREFVTAVLAGDGAAHTVSAVGQHRFTRVCIQSVAMSKPGRRGTGPSVQLTLIV